LAAHERAGRRRPARAAASSASPVEQWHVELVGELLAAAFAEDREVLAAGVLNEDMFSITPPISRSTLCAICAARRATRLRAADSAACVGPAERREGEDTCSSNQLG